MIIDFTAIKNWMHSHILNIVDCLILIKKKLFIMRFFQKSKVQNIFVGTIFILVNHNFGQSSIKFFSPNLSSRFIF